MSDNIAPTDFDRFLAELDNPVNVADMGWADLLDPIGHAVDHASVDVPSPAKNLDSCPLGLFLRQGSRQCSPVEEIDRFANSPLFSMPIEESGYIPSALPDFTASSPSENFLSTNIVAPSRQTECAECGVNFFYLGSHARGSGHKAYRCKLPGCNEGFVSENERDAHQRRPHLQNHGRVDINHPFACAECMAQFASKSRLEKHANEAQHGPFACTCGKRFARLDVLNRHLDSLGNDMPKYPCQFCKRHRGKDGFRRRDHLLQHIRGYHKFEAEEKIGTVLPSRRGKYQVPPVCPHHDCPSHRDESFKHLSLEKQNQTKPFNTQAEYTKHMKAVHDFTPYPCTVSGCNKTGAKGYAREKDLINHREKEHPEAATYMPKPRDIRITCRQPGCSAKMDSNSMYYHVLFKH